ncbi:TIGR03557 family F420-dependent LLM class oxidoreductase [Microbacterium sp. LRZ72]|uniref:TIGR03557 family F420-dependent LLM class oxidoreductase n=1 Tax=Microbacterium sp. LRZ72 TaxID=2942481 RepID=UPI0029BDBE22|nr:TIGR03557 family F420-dependent LLM class oxidoreductase [Microbacterium sp. LRZ72]MDX2375427.1 TIGR03557 family F420-dependent LLM class oxidoreductase [Microbacterium sp. LRZ72]
MKIGYKLGTEGFPPEEIIRQAVRAEEAGFDFVEMSDHYHPWLEAQGHSGFTWSMFGAIAARTERVGLVTGVTCPTMRYHPAIVAQAAATMAIISDGRFTLGVGAGERLNEHVIGMDWPSARKRHAMLREALEIIRLLWSGGYRNYDGRYLQLEDARVFDLPKTLPVMAVAASGNVSARIAAELGDGLFATDPESSIVDAFRSHGGSGPRYAEAPLAYASTPEEGAQAVVEKVPWFVTGWKVMSELPNPVNFASATTTVREEDALANFACGPDVERHAEVIAQYTDAGFDHIVLQNAGPDPDAFIDFFAEKLRPRLTG